jgi:TolA-binding protein
VRLEPSSAIVVVENAARHSLVVLERGAARFSLPHRSGRPAFVVQAGDARVEVVGTRFRVARVGGSAEVETYEGTVRLIAHGETRLLGRGQRWSGAAKPVAAETLPAQPPAAANAGEPAGAAAARPAAESVLGRPDLQRRFEQAARREKREPQQALRIYRSLAKEQRPWAQNALYASARLQVELGERARARAALQRYLQLYPDGANAADARALLGRLR